MKTPMRLLRESPWVLTRPEALEFMPVRPCFAVPLIPIAKR